ncbi:uncharacterized protein IAS62_002788 [Cryptococcus decagattii]|uniref:Uncharacterized protein n=1 Tax=Cryptococcus decagattii TaxID=1859122 RepID=A0ABZ2AUD1_9TREE
MRVVRGLHLIFYILDHLRFNNKSDTIRSEKKGKKVQQRVETVQDVYSVCSRPIYEHVHTPLVSLAVSSADKNNSFESF